MARKLSPTLTEAELKIMQVVWRKDQATVAEVLEELRIESDLAYNTVLTTMQILERKGYLKHTKEGKAFVYSPVVDKKEAQQSAIRHLVSRFFNNSPELLVLNILEREKISAKELERLR